MNMPRIVEPELLDQLPAHDPRAIRSRGDLRRINGLMATTSLLARALDPLLANKPDAHFIELGAGDGSVMLRVAQARKKRWPPMRLGLLDMQPVVGADVLDSYRAIGWTPNIIHADVFDWLATTPPSKRDAPIIVANLFLHHFEGVRLSELLHGIASRAQAFVCLEPRRSSTALMGSHLLGAIGCNAVTRHDAVVSVRAGFNDGELSAQWPADAHWNLSEGKAGLFSHRFVATHA
ncbi:MAG: hypothetical protein ACMG50_09005 [Thermomonas sp.]